MKIIPLHYCKICKGPINNPSLRNLCSACTLFDHILFLEEIPPIKEFSPEDKHYLKSVKSIKNEAIKLLEKFPIYHTNIEHKRFNDGRDKIIDKFRRLHI